MSLRDEKSPDHFPIVRLVAVIKSANGNGLLQRCCLPAVSPQTNIARVYYCERTRAQMACVTTYPGDRIDHHACFK